MNNKVIIICGPTATGKSALAVELAKQHNVEVISADSRQVYTGLDIGSAKITESEMQGVPHHLINVADPNGYFSVADFQKLAQDTINNIHSRGKLPIICGGTGMYIDAVVYNMKFPEVPPNNLLRKELEQVSTEQLFEKLITLDPDRAHNIDKNNRVRLIRALEIALHSPSPEAGEGWGEVEHKPDTVPHPNPPLHRGGENTYNTLWIGLNLPKEVLQERIRERINARIFAKDKKLRTLFDEINDLYKSEISFERLESFGLEYRYGSEYVQGKITLDEFVGLLATKTWQYAKRQMTWFKRNQQIHWCNPISDKQKILKLVQDFWSD